MRLGGQHLPIQVMMQMKARRNTLTDISWSGAALSILVHDKRTMHWRHARRPENVSSISTIRFGDLHWCKNMSETEQGPGALMARHKSPRSAYCVCALLLLLHQTWQGPHQKDSQQDHWKKGRGKSAPLPVLNSGTVRLCLQAS